MGTTSGHEGAQSVKTGISGTAASILYGGERGTRTLDLGIMSAVRQKIVR